MLVGAEPYKSTWARGKRVMKSEPCPSFQGPAPFGRAKGDVFGLAVLQPCSPRGLGSVTMIQSLGCKGSSLYELKAKASDLCHHGHA